MDTRCFDLLDIPNLDGLELVGGKEGLSNAIYWVHTAESATSVIELFEWLKPDDFLIIIGAFMRDNKNALYEIMCEAVKTKLSGILLYKSSYCEFPPKYMVDMAEKNNLPLFFLPNHDVSAIEFSYHLTRMIMHNIENEDFPEKILKDIHYGYYENSDMRIKRSEQLGYDLDRSHCGVAIRAFNRQTAEAVCLDKKEIEICRECLREYSQNAPLQYVDDKTIIALIPKLEGTKHGISGVCQKIINRIVSKNDKIFLLAGIGEEKENVDHFKTSINEAIEITRILKLFNEDNIVKTYADMLPHILIYQLKDDELAQKFYHSTFESLIEYDKRHSSNLVRVLREYIYANNNITQTSKKLFMHRNTIIYQLKKIEELTGMQLRKPENTFRFMMGFYLENLT